MTGTEMIDAIAHIDEDLIDGCVARMKARSSETAALHAKEAIHEKTKKPLSAFAKAAIAFGALAAVLLLSFALISLLHIGGKSPTPIGPVSTQTPAPTEAGNEDGESPFRYSVAVVLDNEESLKFKTYGAEDFPEADAIEVVNVSEALEKSIRELVENGVNNEDVKEYNKCLRIVLKDPCEENASACASRLRERDHVVSAEPYLEPYDVTIEGLRCSIAETILNAAGKITVADRVFLYPRSFHIDVTNEEDGRVYDLSYAYKNGMMTYDGLSVLYRIHVEYMIRKFGYTEETYKKEAFVHYAFIGSCEIGFAHEETGEIEVKDVAGSKFIFVHPFTIVVQKIGEEDILDITEAYEAGLLTEEDVAEAARLHRDFVISTFDFGEKLYEELAAEPTEAPTPVDTFAEEILSVPVKWYSYDELSASPELGEEMTYLESIEDMEMVHYSPEAFCVTDDGEIAIVDTVGARLCVYDLASGQLKKSVQVGQILEAYPVRAAKYGGVYYVLIPYSDSRIVAVYPDGTTSEIPVPQLKGMLEYSHVSEFYAEDGRLILTLIGPSSIETKAVSLSDGSVTGLYSTQWTLENDTFTVTRNGMRWSFSAEPSSGVRSTRIDVLKVGENGELYVIQEVPIEGQDDMGLYQIYDKDGRLIRCEKIDYFMDSYMTADGGRTVGPDDNLYEMHCDEDAVRIFRIVPAEQTADTEPTEQPTDEPAAQTDTDALRAFFELADENGVKNGKKLFPYYDPNNKRSWSNPRMDPAALSWDENGNLTGIILNACYDISSDCELAGELKLCGFSELKSIKITNTITVRSINVSNCPKLESFGAYGIYDELHFSAARPPEDFNFNPKKMLECRFTEMSDVVLTPGDSACMPCFWGFRNQGDENTYMFIGCDVSNPYTFDCWFDRNGEFYSAESRLSLAEAEPPAGGDWVLSARSKDKEPYYSQYEGTLPTASDMLVSLENGVPAKFDIDFDGIPDTLTAVMTEYSSYDREFALTIVRGAFPDDPFTFSVRGCSNLFAVYVMDCDITDERLDIIFSAGGDIAQQIESLHAFRVDPEGNGILDISFKYDNGLIFTGRRGMFAERGVFDPTKGIPVLIFTDLMDTQGVVGRFTVTNDGLMLISPFCFYPDGPETRFFRELERSMDVTAMNNGVPGEKITLNKGQVFAAYRTDLWSWLELILEDGRIVRAELDTRYGGYLINGIEQDEYCEMHYAG